jgi:hypothetical protein
MAFEMDFNGTWDEYQNRVDKCSALLSNYLNMGQLGLFLGSGVSNALELPSWETLVNRCIEKKLKGEPIITGRSNTDLKLLTSRVKATFTKDADYLQLVSEALYENVDFNFILAKKEMLIALTSLMVGKNRGNVTEVMTLNFDSVLEWYLMTNGIRVNVVTKNHLLALPSDVDILHLHGYLPYDKKYGNRSDELVFTHEEFIVRERGDSYWKQLMNEFFKRKIFLTVGLGIGSVKDDIIPYLITLNSTWYEKENLKRKHIYGVCYLTHCGDDDAKYLLQNGVIPCVIADKNDIPPAIFQIAQQALR